MPFEDQLVEYADTTTTVRRSLLSSGLEFLLQSTALETPLLWQTEI
jgi:hypothetical protein